ncbi:ABC transporter substrate-binding protein [Achromobacter xylosoxidans]
MRQALDLAIDRDVLNQVIGEGMFQPAHQPFPPASFAFNKAVEHTGRDPKKAQALLKEAGLDRVKFEITFGNNTTMQQVFELIQAMGAEAGFDITLQYGGVRLVAVVAGARRLRGRPERLVGPSRSQWQHPPVPELQGQPERRQVLRPRRRQAAERRPGRGRPGQAPRHVRPVLAVLEEQRPIIYLFYLPWTFGVQKKVEGFVPYPDGLIRLKGVSVAGK